MVLIDRAATSQLPQSSMSMEKKLPSRFKDVFVQLLWQVYGDKSYDWRLKTPPSTWLIKQATGVAGWVYKRSNSA